MSSGAFPDRPPKPRLTLRVGIAGKRALPEAEVARVRAALVSVFDALAKFMVTVHAEHRPVLADEPPLLRVTSGMAEGADQLAADVVFERFKQESAKESALHTRLAAMLPFARKEYEKDFAKDPNKRERTPEELKRFLDEFEGILIHPAVEAVLEIDDETILDPSNPDYRNLAYANLRDLLLEHTDVLVAISDDIDGGPGGTVDVIRIAVREGIPVIKISTRKPQIYLMQAAALDQPDQTPKEDEELSSGTLPEKLATAIGRMIAPPGMPLPNAGHPQEHHSHEVARPARVRLDLFFRESFAPGYFDRVFKSFRDALGANSKAGALLWWKAFVAFFSTWFSYRRKLGTPEKKAEEMWPDRYNPFAGDGGNKARNVLAVRHGWADILAIRYADGTRSAHIVIAALGALAVLIAVTTLVLPDKPDQTALIIKVYALVLEVAVLLVAGRIFFRPAHDQRWHERMVEYRAVAELLRHERFIYALGAADRPAKNADRTWSEPDAWVGWYVRATLRELGFPTKVLSGTSRRAVLGAFLKDELQGDYGQIAYNESLAKRFNTIDRRLEKIVRWVFWLTVYAGIAGIVVLTVLGIVNAFSHDPEHGFAHDAIHYIKPWFTVIAAFIPAMIAAIHGIRFQIEFRSAAIRADATRRELHEIERQTKLALGTPSSSPGRKQSVALVRAANEAMSADLAGWSSVYRGKGPELG